jgi:hypothetical protein
MTPGAPEAQDDPTEAPSAAVRAAVEAAGPNRHILTVDFGLGRDRLGHVT